MSKRAKKLTFTDVSDDHQDTIAFERLPKGKDLINPKVSIEIVHNSDAPNVLLNERQASKLVNWLVDHFSMSHDGQLPTPQWEEK